MQSFSSPFESIGGTEPVLLNHLCLLLTLVKVFNTVVGRESRTGLARFTFSFQFLIHRFSHFATTNMTLV
jgi:hypothetical protein